MKKTAFIAAMFLMALFVLACSAEDPNIITTDTTVIGDTDTVKPDNQLPDTDTPVTDTPVTDSDEPVTDDPVTDTEVSDIDSPNIGKNCKTDTECGTPLICVNAKCAAGCASAADCANFAGTTCNTKLGRCVNATASSGACSEASCPAGCCYADKGFTALKCMATAALATCGICKQGEVYMGGTQCVPAACKVGETKCQTYNSTDPNAKCFECKTGDLLCYENTTTCNTGSALMLLNAKECIPAGEVCSENDTCCSGQPCIQGYCY